MSIANVALGLIAALVAFWIGDAFASLWRKRGHKFTLRVGPCECSLIDSGGEDVCTIRSRLSYRPIGDSFELTAVGDVSRNKRPDDTTIHLLELRHLPEDEAVPLFSAFALYSLARVREERRIPFWRYATLALLIDETLSPIFDLARQARRAKILRNAITEVSMSSRAGS